VATLPPRAADAAGSAPVFERKTRTALGLLHIRRYRCDAAPICFGKLAPVVALWQTKRRGAALPRWKDFGIEDFVGWHRNVALSDLMPNADPRFRIFGSGAAELIGADLTGKRLSEVVPAAVPDGVLQHFAEIRDGRLIGLLAGNVGRPGLEHRTFKVVELPLENDEGEVAQILHCFLSTRGDQ
jgi:hypothetical protein